LASMKKPLISVYSGGQGGQVKMSAFFEKNGKMFLLSNFIKNTLLKGVIT